MIHIYRVHRHMWCVSLFSNDKLWCYVQSNSLFNSELSPSFTCKILRLGNYQNVSYSQFSKSTHNKKLLVCIYIFFLLYFKVFTVYFNVFIRWRLLKLEKALNRGMKERWRNQMFRRLPAMQMPYHSLYMLRLTTFRPTDSRNLKLWCKTC